MKVHPSYANRHGSEGPDRPNFFASLEHLGLAGPRIVDGPCVQCAQLPRRLNRRYLSKAAEVLQMVIFWKCRGCGLKE